MSPDGAGPAVRVERRAPVIVFARGGRLEPSAGRRRLSPAEPGGPSRVPGAGGAEPAGGLAFGVAVSNTFFLSNFAGVFN